MAIGLFLEYESRIVQFPVNPSEIELTGESNNSNVEVIRLGEISELGIRKLKEVSFESFLPNDKNSGSYITTKNSWWGPNQYIEFIEKIRDSKKPCRFVVTDTKINILASIEEFDFRHQSGNSEDVYFRLGLKEFRPYGANYIKIIRNNSTNNSNSTSNKLSVGDEVIVNGRLHHDSYGSAPGQTEVNARRRISHIVTDPSRPYPIHVTLLNNSSQSGYRGWVTTGSVRKA